MSTCSLHASEHGEKGPRRVARKRTQKGCPRGIAGSTVCNYPRNLGSTPSDVKFIKKMEFIETHRIWCTCFRGRFRPGIGTDSVGPGFGLVIGSTSVSRLEVECCTSNHIHVSSQCPNTFPEIRELLRQMGSGLVVTK